MDELKKIFIKKDSELNWKGMLKVAFWVWLTSGVIILIHTSTLEEAGQFGDMFGAVNALFSGLALIGVVVAIFYQRSELKLQRKELELTREEMKNQRKEMAGQKEQLAGQKQILDKQHETATIQQFENAFYQMLQSHIDLNRSMYKYEDDNYYETDVIGNALFEVFYHKSNDISFQEAHNDYNEQVVPYLFRVERILDLIHNSSVDNKETYVRVLRSTCTSCELKVMELCLANVKGFTHLRSLLKKYSFLSLLDYGVPLLHKSRLL